MSSSPPVIAILGPGTVGTALVRSLHAAGQTPIVGGRNARKARQLAEAIGTTGGDLATTAESAAVSILTVTDDAIEAVCESLAEAGCWSGDDVVLHCSGALDADVLSAARDRGAACGSWHPLQTFASGKAVASLAGVPFFCEGDEAAIQLAERLTEAIGGRFARIQPGGKALYHAAAVMACNYVSTLMDAAETLMSQAGIATAKARDALGPLVRQTVDNALSTGPAETLTGPIVRGDARTVRRHLAAMHKDGLDDLARLYRAVGMRAADVAERRGTCVADVRNVLNEATNNSSERETGE